MSHVDDENSLQHKIFTWIGVAGFLGGVVVYPSFKMFTGADMNPWLILGIIAASVAAVGSKQVVEGLATLVEAWRSG